MTPAASIFCAEINAQDSLLLTGSVARRGVWLMKIGHHHGVQSGGASVEPPRHVYIRSLINLPLGRAAKAPRSGGQLHAMPTRNMPYPSDPLLDTKLPCPTRNSPSDSGDIRTSGAVALKTGVTVGGLLPLSLLRLTRSSWGERVALFLD